MKKCKKDMTQLKHRQYTFFIGSLHIKTAIMRRPTHSDEQHQTNTALEPHKHGLH